MNPSISLKSFSRECKNLNPALLLTKLELRQYHPSVGQEAPKIESWNDRGAFVGGS